MTAASSRTLNWRALAWAFLFFWYFSGALQLALYVFGFANSVGFRQATLVSLFWLFPLIIWPAKTRLLSASIGLVLWLASLPALTYFLIYHQEFSQSVIFIVFESNVSEGTEYFQQYFSWTACFILIAYSALAYFLWRKVKPISENTMRPYQWFYAILFIFCSIGYQIYHQYEQYDDWDTIQAMVQEKLEPASPWQMIFGYTQYREQLNNMQALLEDSSEVPPLAHLQDKTQGLPATLVLVIGESTNKQMMSLYGYDRKTTPQLDALKAKGELAVFTDVITPRPYTIEALQQVLSFANQQQPDAYLTQPTLLSMMKQAGYKTFWITNQQTMTRRNTMLTFFSQQADEQVYLNNNREQNSRQYDDDVLKPFQEALADPAKRKMIVVHLLGTHLKYEYRYPESWDKFHGKQGAPSYLNDEELAIYNTYDNAILFNDYVVSSLIHSMEKTQSQGFLFYLSDHGENVYSHKRPHFLGRDEANPTRDMYTIPFILWQSASWKATFARDLSQAEVRPYSTENFIYTFADMAGLSFEGFDASKSLINSAFKPALRYIGNPHQPKTLHLFDKMTE